MDFFARQDQARHATVRLLWMFNVCVVLMVVCVTFVTGYVTSLTPELQQYQVLATLIAGLATLLVILIASAWKRATLASGGEAVAAIVGAVPLSPDPVGTSERMLQHVVEEMAIASGTPMPRIYIIDDPAINAFAAGHNPRDAAIVVSRGALDRLSRDEMQGVVAHEFSHLLNGDTHLNLRLIGWSFGLLVLAMTGRIILSNTNVFGGSRRNSGGGGRGGGGGGAVILVIVAAAVTLLVIGYLGYFMSQVLKAAVSRQREFLADASAVQFTRNPLGIGGALKKIGFHSYRSFIQHDHIDEISHLFFADAVSQPFFGLLATHPPLEARIRAIDPSWNGVWTEVEPIHPVQRTAPANAPVVTAMATHSVVAQIGRISPEHVAFGAALLSSFDPLLVAAARIPFSARAIALVAIVGAADERSAAQRTAIKQADPLLAQEFERLWPLGQSAGEAARLPLLNLSCPTLRQLTADQKTSFLATITAVASSSGDPPLAEYVLSRLVRVRLDPPLAVPNASQSLMPLSPSLAVLLSELAWAGASNPSSASAAFAVAIGRLTLSGEALVIPMPDQRATSVQLDAALEVLCAAGPGVKRRILSACAWCVAADGTVLVREAELLRAIADSFGCPLPPFMNSTAT